MKLAGSTALVTGSNRGLGRHLAEQLIARGATVYAAARNPASVDVPGAIPITLDITDPAPVAQLALDAVEAGQIEILADGMSANIRAGLAAGARALYPQFA